MYGNEIPSPRQEVPDNVSEGGTLAENKEIREKKVSPVSTVELM